MKRVRPQQMSGEPPGVTVVIPCFNYARYLPDAVGSALAQDGVAVNVVILDDASTDDSVAVAEELVAADPRVRLEQHPVNRGHVETANEALHWGTGEFLVKLDADDLLTAGSLLRSASLLRANPEVVFCYGYAQDFQGQPPQQYPDQIRNWSIWPGQQWIRRVLRRGHNVIAQPEVMLRRESAVNSGGYRPQLRWAEDYNWWLRLATTGAVGRVNGPTQGLYRVHPASFQRSAEDLELSDLRARVAAVELFFDECSPRLDDPAGLRRLGYASLAREARRHAARVAAQGKDCSSYEAIVDDLEHQLAGGRQHSLSANRTALGAAYRNLEDRWRWRRWRRYGT